MAFPVSDNMAEYFGGHSLKYEDLEEPRVLVGNAQHLLVNALAKFACFTTAAFKSEPLPPRREF